MKHLWLPLLLLACDGGGKDGTGTDDTDPAADTDSSPTLQVSTEACVVDNEACAPGEPSCRGEGDDMLPGSNCLACHKAGERIDVWTAGGTIFADADGTDGVRGAIIRITDADGAVEELESSRSGNFHTRAGLTPPLSVEVEYEGRTIVMQRTVETGACNSCHTCDGEANAKLYLP